MKFDSNKVSMYLILVLFLLVCGYVMKRGSESYINMYSNYPASMPMSVKGTSCGCGKGGSCGCGKRGSESYINMYSNYPASMPMSIKETSCGCGKGGSCGCGKGSVCGGWGY